MGSTAVEENKELFEEKIRRITQTLSDQQAESVKLDADITNNQKELGDGW
jgi:hypothetical protein